MYQNKEYKYFQNCRFLFLAIAFVLMAALPEARAFTQSGVGIAIGNGIPMGHEWITRMAALELLGGDPIMKPDPNDPRSGWTQGLAKNTDLSGSTAEVERIKSMPYPDGRYQSTYKFVYDAIVGERWVDIAGFDVTKSKIPGNTDCFDAVAQEPAEVQFDHFMRRYDNEGGLGSNAAITSSQQRFVAYFIAAATAPQMQMKVWDGGGYSALTTADRNYFLFGRAVHLFEDSFSSEHVVRIPDDNFVKVRQIKSYLCAKGAEQHTHSTPTILDYSSGDVIWKPGTSLMIGWPSYKPSNMKTVALVAAEATKDLWAAFIRTMATPASQREAKARQEALKLVENWLQGDAYEILSWYNNQSNRDDTYVFNDGESGKGQTQSDCMKKLKVASGSQAEKVAQLQNDQKRCLYNVLPKVGYADLFDTSLHMPFNWEWKNSIVWKQPPPNWTVPDRPADTGHVVKIKSAALSKYMHLQSYIISANQIVYVMDDNFLYPALDFINVPGTDINANTNDTYFFRLRNDPDLFLYYNGSPNSDRAKLFYSAFGISFKLEPQADGSYAIKSDNYDQYLWSDNTTPYVLGSKNFNNTNARWNLEAVSP